ncbi:MAG: glycerol-3-phosphate acyltransferase [Dehalococcoidales bacterium]
MEKVIINNFITGIIAVVIGYLLGSVPFAYIFTRLAAGKDVRQISGGNVGARNTFLNIGKSAGIATGVLDVVKGLAAVAIAWFLMGSPSFHPVSPGAYFVLAAGLAAVAGHIRPIFLKFKGGNGLATTFGVFLFILPWEMLAAVCITIILWALTRNVILSFNLSLVSVPFSAGFITHSWVYILYPLIVVALMLTHFGPVIAAEIRGAHSSRELLDDLFRRKKTR